MAERRPSSPVSECGLQASLPRSAYVGAPFFDRERRAIFWDQWFYAGRVEQFPVPGSYRVIDVAGESVIVVRGEDGLFAHFNLCRHRGSRLLCGEGRLAGAIRCPYHSWTYRLDGTLVASPFVDAGDVPEDARRLYGVGVQTWAGFAFVHLSERRSDHNPQTLVQQLGAVPERLTRYPLADLRVSRTLRYQVAANWKVILENYNECYHCAGVHPELCRIVPAFRQRGGSGLDWNRGIAHREGAWTFTSSGTSDRAPFAPLDRDERVRHKGELIYPNFMLSLAADHAAAFSLWPQDPGNTTVVCDFLFHPDEMEKGSFDPTDAVDFWDVINRQDWAICANVQAGMQSHVFRYGYYAPMEDSSRDIRRYVGDRLGEDAVAIEPAPGK